MAQKIGGFAFAIAVGLLVAWFAYQSKPSEEARAQRDREEAIVLAATAAVRGLLGGGADLQIVDPLNPNRVAGKAFVYPIDQGFEVSGFYRRSVGTLWQPWIVRLDRDGQILDASAAGPDGRIELRAHDTGGESAPR